MGYYGVITEIAERRPMARTVIDKRLAKREQRLRLAPQKEPYWMMLNEGEHLGYYRGARVAKWVARFRLPHKGASYQRITLGEVDEDWKSAVKGKSGYERVDIG